jgi:hypothetical protein
MGRAVLPAARALAAGVRRAVVGVLRAVAGVLLRVLDLVWLGDPVRVLGWCLLDVARRVKSGQGERLFGLWLVVGLYGSGKTAWVVHELEDIRRKRGDKVAIFTNFGWQGEDGPIRGWRHMLEALDGDVPTIFAWDELGSSLTQHDHGKDFPKDLFRFVTQMRKGPGVRVYATVQRFSNASVDLRRLAKYIIEVRGYLGARWVWSWAYDGYEEYNDGLPRVSAMSQRDMRKVAWRRMFVFSDWLRSRYDSFAVIPALKEWSDDQMAARAGDDQAARDNYAHLQLTRRTTEAGGPAALAPAPRRRLAA